MQHQQARRRLARFAIALCFRPAAVVVGAWTSASAPLVFSSCSSHSPPRCPAAAPAPWPYYGTFSQRIQRLKRNAVAAMDDSPASSGRPIRKPRVVIVGAGMAGIAAAQRLHQAAGERYDLTILEASNRIGGRICSSEFHGEGIELGATWIHGIEGSPLYKTALLIGAMQNAERAWEGMDGFLAHAIVKAEGGVDVSQELVNPVVEVYKQLLQEAQEMGVVQAKEMVAGSAIDATPLKISDTSNCISVGAYLRQGLDRFLAQQLGACQDGSITQGGKSFGNRWTKRSLQEGCFKMHENLERNITSADDLYDIDLVDYNEYWEFPGEHKTIAKGYSSVVKALASCLPSGVVQFGKSVEKIVWNKSTPFLGAPVQIHCEGGSVLEADHVILTVSLGVLKAKTLRSSNYGASEGANADNSALACQASSLAEKSSNLFYPPLPEWKLDSISRLGFGVVNKVFVQIEPAQERGHHTPLQFIFDPSTGQEVGNQSVSPAWIRKSFSLYPINEKSHTLVTWFAGREAMQVESLTDEEILSGISKTLASFGIPESQQGKFLAICRSSWGTNPLFRGSYSYVRVGSTGDDIDTLAEPLPKLGDGGVAPLQILFAGEATHRHYYSTTHGAYFSGLREAERLMQHHGLLA